MAEPLYAKVVAGYEPNERGGDAVTLAEFLAETAGGQLSKVHVEHGSPAKQLHQLAERDEADLIVLGSTHRASLGRVTPGSVAEHLMNGARCRLAIAPRGYARARAVLAAEASGEEADDVPAGSPLPGVREALRVIGVGFDGTPESRGALAEASELARRAGATMRVMGIDPPAPPELGPGSTIIQERLHEATAELAADLRALAVYDRGDPAEKLLERAAEGVDLLVLGSRGFGPVLRLLVGSVSGQVTRDAPCAVMVTPRPQ